MKHVLIYFPRHGNPYEAYDNYEKHQENESKRIHVDHNFLKKKFLLGKKGPGGVVVEIPSKNPQVTSSKSEYQAFRNSGFT